MTSVTYSSNNSGGGWWLSDQNWKDLEAAGWKVDWKKPGDMFVRDDGRYLGALAVEATREGLTLREAIDEWESVTGESSNDLGCSCCGTPHHFYADNGDSYSPEYPAQGSRY